MKNDVMIWYELGVYMKTKECMPNNVVCRKIKLGGSVGVVIKKDPKSGHSEVISSEADIKRHKKFIQNMEECFAS